MSASHVTLRRSTWGETLQVNLTDRRCVVGNDPTADLSVAGADLTPKHARLFWDGNILQVEPIDGAPVAVNGKPASGPTTIAAGDWLALGATLFQVGIAAGQPAPSTPFVLSTCVTSK